MAVIKKERVLITVKTYPTPSTKYIELVCTAGVRKDGSWIRIYPAPFRFLKAKYRKYQWIELSLEKNPKDYRPESYRPCNIEDIKLCEFIPSKRDWEERKRLILDNNTIYTDLHTVIAGAKSNEFSLAIFKPAQIKKFVFKPINPILNPKKEEVICELIRQGSLFDKTDNFVRTKQLPYKFSYEFIDDKNVNSTLMIADWEIGQLYWNCRKIVKSDEEAIQLVQQKYYNDIANTKDVYFFLGTTFKNQKIARNPYIIIGIFYPQHTSQLQLDL